MAIRQDLFAFTLGQLRGGKVQEELSAALNQLIQDCGQVQAFSNKSALTCQQLHLTGEIKNARTWRHRGTVSTWINGNSVASKHHNTSTEKTSHAHLGEKGKQKPRAIKKARPSIRDKQAFALP